MARTITIPFRTKSEAKAAIKAGEVIHVTTHDGTPLPKASGGPYFVTVKLDHYKSWDGEAYCDGTRVYRLA